MDQVQTAQCGDTGCAKCAEREAAHRESQEMAFAFLLALMPIITLTFFGQVGLL